MGELIISGVSCYEQDGIAYLRLEDVARGLGFTEVAASGNECVKWSRVKKYLSGFGVDTSVDGNLPEYIPENIFYRLAMKAKNETAEKFQALVADEIIPSVRKHGAYMTPETLQAAILNPDYLLQVVTALKSETDKRKALEAANSQLSVQNQIMQPKADYFDEMVERNLLTNFRETAKMLEVKERAFLKFLLEKKYIYRDKRGKLLPSADKNDGLFEVKECINEKTKWSGTQTLITPKGRETFRLLCKGL